LPFDKFYCKDTQTKKIWEVKFYIFVVELLVMNFFRVLLSIVFPPLAVVDQGCGSIIIVFILTLCGWVPGVIAALVILNNPKRWSSNL
jgi:uncharacterized membrane protein YqaE (UPF0057 family)